LHEAITTAAEQSTWFGVRVSLAISARLKTGEMNMSRRIHLGAAALVAALAAGPVMAQPTAPAVVQTEESRNDFPWGLLGLLGLAGLAPLFMRKDRHGNVHTDTRP
jgi:hypothetical protein